MTKGVIVLLLLLAATGAIGWRAWAWWTAASAPPIASGAPDKPVKLRVPQGTSAQEIGRDLQALGVIRSATAWDLWSRWLMFHEPEGGFKAGIYQLSRTEALEDVATKIWSGDVVHLSYTIPEGWSLRQMAAYFEAEGFFSAQDFLTAVERLPTAQYAWLPTNRAPGQLLLEGFLYPDTYQVSGLPAKPETVLKQMLDRFEQVALPLYEQGHKQKQSEHKQTALSFTQWVTLASIVEKEAVIANERTRIAGVFMNRLRKKIPLGADPTVEYGLGIQQTPDQPLSLAQVRTPSAYNTYLNTGLPPTPIASPGLASLKAALNPENTDFLYFVARYDGTHVFSRTLAEHQAAQVIIQDKRKSTKQSNAQGQSQPDQGSQSSLPGRDRALL
ncbi:endolytic transglycosylase MltG [Stenomitos frigidus]|nr:endolytic transglycosylase MltG [Stenomitos frigidus]